MPKFIDLRTYNGSSNINADIIIVGAGAAGITLAKELSAKNKSVVLLESGNLEYEGETQSLYSGSNTGMEYFDLMTCRLRYFGGTTNHWGGYTNYNSELDINGRKDLGILGWPIEYSDYVSYIKKAAIMLDVDFSEYSPAEYVSRAGYDPKTLIESQSEHLNTTTFLRTKKRRFAVEFRDTLEQSESLQVYLHANVCHIQLATNGLSVDYLKVKTLENKEFTVTGKSYVLACHAIENARLLLLSNDIHQSGIGNASDHVGRNFMDHIHIIGGKLFPGNAEMSPFYFNDPLGENKTNAVISIPDETRNKEGMLSYYMRFFAVYVDDHWKQSVSNLKDSFFDPFTQSTMSAMSDAISDLGSASRYAQIKMGKRKVKPLYYELDHRIEQSPNPNSRITLTNEVDSLGLKKVNLNWDITDLDVHSFNRGQDLVMKEFSALGLGRFSIKPFTKKFLRENLIGHWHHLGTTRMSEKPRDGVVDKNSQVHGVGNLFVAGSSVFPASGKSGPTLSVVAMAIRLSDHLLKVMSK